MQVRLRGGATQTLTIPVAQKSWQTSVTPPELVQMIDDLLNEGTDAQVATILNERGLHPGKGGSFQGVIGRIRRTYGLRAATNDCASPGCSPGKKWPKLWIST